MSKILIVDDEVRILMLIQTLLKGNGYETIAAKTGEEALGILAQGGIDVMITDLRMAPMDGLTLIKKVKETHAKLPMILLTAYASVETAIDAMKCGAFDYLTKPFKVDEMLATVKRAEASVAEGGGGAKDADAGGAASRYRFENIVATSPAMLKVCEMIQRVAPTAATVLIYGESGTGKEVVARAIHSHSPRKEKPWVAVNCAAIPADLLESELFGHVKGAFTGAVADKPGLFETANGGTIFLDEVSSMPLPLQGKLLRVLQEKEIRRVGGNETIPVDVRVIAASNANLEQMAAEGTFRTDLYYRFAVITIEIPPLRDRAEDILPLAAHFLRGEAPAGASAPTLGKDAQDILAAYKWPGNVRELENAIKHAVTFRQEGEIRPEDLPEKIVARARETLAAAPQAAATAAAPQSLKSFLKNKEKEYLSRILADSDGDKEKAAKTLQVSLATLYRKISDDAPAAPAAPAAK
jgi:DNA-binding NtrC family response regulator